MAAEHLAGLLCHHGDDEAGHELDPSCPLQVKAGRYEQAALDRLVDQGRAPVVLAAVRELRKRARCAASTDAGTRCRNRATVYPYCGVHA